MANSGQASSLIKTQIPIYSGAARMGIVVFEVGPHRVKYAIHKAFLAKHSSYGGLMDLAISQQQVIDLHSVECTTFEVIVNWLYVQQFQPPDQSNELGEPIDADDVTALSEKSFFAYLDVYIFADFCSIPALRCAMNNEISWWCRIHPLKKHLSLRNAIRMAWDVIPHDRIIWESLVEAYLGAWDLRNPNYSAKALEQLPSTFIRRVMRRAHELITMSQKDKEKQRCHLEHASNKERRECKDLHMSYDWDLEVAIFE